MTAAAKARAAAVHCEVKKHAYRQTQDGFVISFILHPQEVPEEMATAALGTRYIMALSQIGDDEMPVANEVPAPSCHSASSSGEREPESDPGLPAERGHKSPAQSTERRKFDELSPPQQAGILSNEQAFRVFLTERFPDEVGDAMTRGRTSDEVFANVVRTLCGVKSRADIKPDNVEFKSLLLAYRLWQNHPELEDA